MDAVETIEQDDFTPEPEPDDDGVAEQVDEDPVHLAKCAECAEAVKFRPSVTGASFFLVDAEPDATYGIGEHGRPVCPNGHGEMAIADDALKPVPEAFADAQAMLQRAEAEARGGGAPVQGDLPGILPQFNYQGCYLELEEKAAEVDRLHEEYLEAKEVASDAKKAWDRAAELFTKMALEFKRRRQAKGDPGAPALADPPTRALGCTWDKAHPEDACPFCAPDLSLEDRDAIVRLLGAEILPKEANGHADQVRDYRERLDVQETRDALDGIVYDVPLTAIVEMAPELRAAFRAWVAAGAPIEEFPEKAGRPHVAGPAGVQAQCCGVCGVILRAYEDIASAPPADILPADVLVRLDCQGAQPEPEHHYPDTSKPKARSRQLKAEKPAKKARGKKGGR